MNYFTIELPLSINQTVNNQDSIKNLSSKERGILEEAYVTYIYYNTNLRNIYIGETKQFVERHDQHMREEHFKKGKFNECLIIFNASKFTKSHVEDLEYMLINFMFAETDTTKFTFFNRNNGKAQPRYEGQDQLEQEVFVKLWGNDLFKKGLVKIKELQALQNKILFKYSPFKQLSNQQVDYENTIVENPSRNYLIRGGAGTGKTVLLMSLMFKLLNQYPEKKIGLVTTGNLTSKFNGILKQLKIHKQVKFERAGNIINQARKEKIKYDIILVDEAHRLQRYYRKGHSVAKKHFDKENPSINELEMLEGLSKSIILFYDPFQSIRPQDILLKDFMQQTENYINLNLGQQFRIQGKGDFNGEDFIKGLLYALEISNDNNFNPEVFEGKGLDSYFQIADSIEELFTYIDTMEGYDANSTNRVIAGYSKEWKSNPALKENKKMLKSNKDIEKESDKKLLPYDWKEGENKWRWNSQHEKWIEIESSKKEIGSIHAIQGADIDYVGVIIGKDIAVGESGKLKGVKEHYFDRGGIPLSSQFNEEEFTAYILNVYYVLLTRGVSGCKVYFEDTMVKEYFLRKISEGSLV